MIWGEHGDKLRVGTAGKGFGLKDLDWDKTGAGGVLAAILSPWGRALVGGCCPWGMQPPTRGDNSEETAGGIAQWYSAGLVCLRLWVLNTATKRSSGD